PVPPGVIPPDPPRVVAEPVQRHRALEVVFQCDGGGLADRVERRDEHPETERTCLLALRASAHLCLLALRASAHLCLLALRASAHLCLSALRASAHRNSNLDRKS